MKLRSKILCIAIAVILAALLVGDVIIGAFWYNTMRREALLTSTQEMYYTVSSINEHKDSREWLNLYYKRAKDDYSICYKVSPEIDEIYNHTSLDFEKLMSFDYEDASKNDYAVHTVANGRLSYAYMKDGNRSYLVSRFEFVSTGGIICFKLTDISYIKSDMIKRISFMLIVSISITFLSSLIINLIIKKVFKPLDKLNAQAKQMADGVYDKRIIVDTKDEIGQLAENFNLMADAVETRTESLKKSEQDKTLMMGNLTHELRTPMTAISGYSELLLTAKLSEEDREEALMYINSECKRLEKLSTKMVKLLSVDNEADISLSKVSAKDLFDITGKAMASKLNEADIELEACQNGESFMVDFDLMTEVLISLTDNAIKASPKGSKIILRAADNRIEVEDFGKGIPAEEREKILEPFYMVDKSRSRKSGGAGLGLALVTTILKKHSCVLDIESEVGKGTRMMLQFV